MDGAAIEETLREFFARDPHGAAAVYLFGSMADVGVLLEKDPPPTLHDEIESLLKREVDVVNLNHASAVLRIRALRAGKLILDADKAKRLRFEVAARNEYWDLLPILRRCRHGATDPEHIAKKLARMTTAVQELRTLGRSELVGRDVREDAFIKHTLQMAIQAAIDVAAHVISDESLDEPMSARDVFTILGRHLVIDLPLAEKLAKLVGFRNVIVYEDDEVDPNTVHEIMANGLDDLLDFARLMRARL